MTRGLGRWGFPLKGTRAWVASHLAQLTNSLRARKKTSRKSEVFGEEKSRASCVPCSGASRACRRAARSWPGSPRSSGSPGSQKGNHAKKNSVPWDPPIKGKSHAKCRIESGRFDAEIRRFKTWIRHINFTFRSLSPQIAKGKRVKPISAGGQLQSHQRPASRCRSCCKPDNFKWKL